MKRLGCMGLALLLAGCASNNERPEPTELERLSGDAQLQRVWDVQLDGNQDINSRLYPAIQAERAFAAAGDELAAMDLASGQVLWSVELDTPVAGATSVAGNRVYLSDQAGRVQSFDTESGQADWSFDWGREMVLAPVAGQTSLLIRSTDNDLALLDLQGGLLWERAGQSAALAYRGQARPIAVEGGFIVADDTGDLAAVLVEDGLDAWRRALGTQRDELVDLDADPTLAANMIVAAGARTGVSGYSPQNGSQLFDTDVFSLVPLASNDQTVFATDLDGQVFGINVNNGEILWRQPGLKYRYPSGPAVTTAGVFVVDSLGVAHLLDPQTGEFVARTNTGLAGTVSLTALEQDVIAMDQSGRVIRIGLAD